MAAASEEVQNPAYKLAQLSTYSLCLWQGLLDTMGVSFLLKYFCTNICAEAYSFNQRIFLVLAGMQPVSVEYLS